MNLSKIKIKAFRPQKIAEQIFFTVAFLPLYASCLPFAALELTKFLDVPIYGNKLTSTLTLLVITFASYQTAKLICGLFFEGKHITITKPLIALDFTICSIIAAFILFKFHHYHYVTPSGSVQYYLFYDYVRLFHQTGFYRPNLPIEDPTGTWHSMLTYNPAIGALLSLISLEDKFDSFYRSFGLVTGLFNLGLIFISGAISRQITGLHSLGVLISTILVFFNFGGPALMQLMNVTGAHDTPTLYFCAISLCLLGMFLNEKSYLESYLQVAIITFLTAVIFLGTAIRPYLVALFCSCLTLNLWILREHLSSTKLKLLYKAGSVDQRFLRLSFLSMVVTTIGMAWFVLLTINYGKPVIYNHASQFAFLGRALLSFSYGLEILNSVLLNKDGAYSFAPTINYNIGIASLFLVILSLFFPCKKFFRINRHMALTLIGLVVMTISYPLALQVSLHWKTYIPFLFLISHILPIYLLSILAKHLRSGQILLLAALVILGLTVTPSLNNSVLPDKGTKATLQIDKAFRSRINEVYREYPGKILVLRGGEPGGDSQTNIKNYYYWDHVFLFGDVDTFFINQEPGLLDFKCMLKKRGVTLIFEPETIGIPNHSGTKTYSTLKNLISGNEQIFPPMVVRNDGYNGILYRVKYDGACG